MKKVFIILVGLLIIGGSVYAAGDLIVNGQLGVGTSTLTSKIDASATNMQGSFFDTEWADVSSTGATIEQFKYISDLQDDTGWLKNYYHFQSQVDYQGVTKEVDFLPGTVATIYGYQSKVNLRADQTIPIVAPITAIHKFDVSNADFNLALTVSNTQDVNIRNYYGFRHSYVDAGSGDDVVTGTNWYGGYFGDPDSPAFQPANLYGVYVAKQTRGTSSNYGIVLDGEGAGADLVFGHNGTNRARIYSQGGRLYAQDASFNQTIFSPHDPVTGEWIFYSKNIKTGKVVRVNMEKLVKAVEKLTGETFMVETIMEEGK